MGLPLEGIKVIDFTGVQDLVSKEELIARVWPSTSVGENNLRVQVATLRHALQDGEQGNRYVSNIAGRGYCFVAPVVRSVGPCPLDCRRFELVSRF